MVKKTGRQKNFSEFLLLLIIFSILSTKIDIGLAPDGDDIYEENDSFDTAPALNEGVYTDLKLIDDDLDYFKLTIPSKQLLKVQFSSEDDWAYLSLNMYLYNEFSDSYFIVNQEFDVVDSEQFIISYFNSDNESIEIFLVLDAVWLYLDYYELTYSLEISHLDPKIDLFYEYGIEKDDNLHYTKNLTINFEVSEDFYDEIEHYIFSKLNNENHTILASDFNLESMINELFNFLETPINESYHISDIYGLNLTLFDKWQEYKSMDVFEGSLSYMTHGEEITQYEYEWNRLQAIIEIMEPYFNSTYWDETLNISSIFDEYTLIYDQVSDLEESDHILMCHAILNQSLGQLMEKEEIILENGTTFPNPPLSTYIPGNLPMFPFYGSQLQYFISTNLDSNTFLLPYSSSSLLFSSSSPPLSFPKDFSFQEYWNWGKNALDFYKAYLTEKDEDFVDFNTNSLMENLGITSFTIGNQGFGGIWTFDAVNYTNLQSILETDENINITSDLQEMVELYFSLLGLDYSQFSGSIAYALEYDENMVLASDVLYLSIEGVFDFSGINQTDDLPAIDGESFRLNIAFSNVRNGFSAASKSDIEDGKLAEHRLSEGDIFNFFEQIPGYPIYFVGLLGLISIIILYKRFTESI